MQLVYQYMAISFNFSLTSSHLHPLQVENCDSNSRLVVDEDDNGKLRLERVKGGYLKVLANAPHIRAMEKFRCSAYKLNIEIGRYKGMYTCIW